jgi:hypothetical protein
MKHTLTLLLLLLLVPYGHAQEVTPINAPLDKSTIVLLARAMVSEGNWSETDHAAVAWVLVRRWRRLHPDWTFKRQILAYCVGMRGPIKTERQRWVRNLSRNPKIKPVGWPRNTSWEKYSPRWAAVLAFAEAWAAGKVEDPCRGRSFHWGAPHEEIFARVRKAGWFPVNCGPTQNRFWSVESV